MSLLFYLAGAVALVSTALALTRAHAVHALLYFIVSLFATAVVFFLLGAPFVAALEVIVYAGAIMVLFLFVVMVLDLGPGREGGLPAPRGWPRAYVGPGLLGAVLAGELVILLLRGGGPAGSGSAVGPAEVARALYGPYMVGVELASLLLLAGLVAAYHLARPEERREEDGSPGQPDGPPDRGAGS